MSGSQLKVAVPFLDFISQSAYGNGSNILNNQNGSTENTLFYPILFSQIDGRNQSFGGSEFNGTYLHKKEINSFYFYKVCNTEIKISVPDVELIF